MVTIKHVKLGANVVEYFNYDGDPLPYRPLYSWELDDSFLRPIEDKSPKTIELIIKIKTGSLKDKDMINLDPVIYIELQEHTLQKDYWVVYHGIKDFQDDEFRIEEFDGYPKGYNTIKKSFRHIHELADDIISVTKPPKEVIRELVRNESGRLLSTIHYRLHVPLVSEAWKMTPLQLEFLILSHPSAQEAQVTPQAGTVIKSGMTKKDLYQQMGLLRQDVRGHSDTKTVN